MHAQAWQIAGKRVIDVLGATIGLLLFSPLFLAIAIAVKITSRGPALFIQDRSGRNGRLIPVMKFRTMTTDVKVVEGSETAEDDPRITSIGHYLRKTGLDELPQIFNVIRGHMSLVGPRPLLQWENEMCNERESLRLLMKPGLTGLSQVHGRNAIPWHTRVEWDVRYVERFSISLDLWILLKTVPVMLFGANAYAAPDLDIYAEQAEESLQVGLKQEEKILPVSNQKMIRKTEHAPNVNVSPPSPMKIDTRKVQR